MLGKWGAALYEKSRGRDIAPLVEHWEAKSVGEQHTFARDTFDAVVIARELEESCDRVFRRFQGGGYASCRTICLSIRFADFTTVTSSKSFPAPLQASDAKRFSFEAYRLLLPFFDRRKNPRLKKLRLIGIRMEKLLK